MAHLSQFELVSRDRLAMIASHAPLATHKRDFGTAFSEARPTQAHGQAAVETFEHAAQRVARDMTTLYGADMIKYHELRTFLDGLPKAVLGDDYKKPEIVLVGHKGCGKSTVLQALTQLPHVAVPNTRLPIKFSFKQHKTEGVNISLVPVATRPDEEKAVLQAFKKSDVGTGGLAVIVEEALRVLRSLDTKASRGPANYFSDTLVISIRSSRCPEITFIDPPGLILATGPQASKEDITRVQQITDRYLARENIIVITVVSAKLDYHYQQIISKCSELDVEGDRTFGVITRLNEMDLQTAAAKYWITLVEEDSGSVPFSWYMVTYHDGTASSVWQKHAYEKRFFQGPQFANVKEHVKGIGAFRRHLGTFLLHNLRGTAMYLKEEIVVRHAAAARKLDRLGPAKPTAEEQQTAALRLLPNFETLLKAALKGDYSDDFFNVHDDVGTPAQEEHRRLCDRVMDINAEFNTQFLRFGHKHHIRASGRHSGTNTDFGDRDTRLPSCYYRRGVAQIKHQTRQSALAWVHTVIARLKERELREGNRPVLTSELFFEQSDEWHTLVTQHLVRLVKLFQSITRLMIKHINMPDHIHDCLFGAIAHALEKHRLRAHSALMELVKASKRHQIIEFHAESQFECDSFKVYPAATQPGLSPNLPDLYSTPRLQYREKSPEDSLDCQIKFYKQVAKDFLQDVSREVFDKQLLRGLVDTICTELTASLQTEAEYDDEPEDAEVVSDRAKYAGRANRYAEALKRFPDLSP